MFMVGVVFLSGASNEQCLGLSRRQYTTDDMTTPRYSVYNSKSTVYNF